MKLSIWEFICPLVILQKNKKLDILEKSKKLVWSKLSVENLIERNFKINQLAKFVLNESQLKEFYSNSKAIFSVENENESKGIQESSMNSKSNLKLIQANCKDDIVKPFEKLNEQYDIVKNNNFS